MKYNFFDDIPKDEYTIDIMTIDPADKDVFKADKKCDVYITCKTAQDIIVEIQKLFSIYKKYSLIIHTLTELQLKIKELLDSTTAEAEQFFNDSPKKQSTFRESLRFSRKKQIVQNYKAIVISDMNTLLGNKSIITKLIDKFTKLQDYYKNHPDKEKQKKDIFIYANSNKCIVEDTLYLISGISISVDNKSYKYTLHYKEDSKSSTIEKTIELTKLCIVKNIDDIPNIHNINNIDNTCITQEKPKDVSTPAHTSTDPELTQDIRKLELEFNNEQIKLKTQLLDSITTELSILSHMLNAWHSSKQPVKLKEYHIKFISNKIDSNTTKQVTLKVEKKELENKNKTLKDEIDKQPVPYTSPSAGPPAGPPAGPSAGPSAGPTSGPTSASSDSPNSGQLALTGSAVDLPELDPETAKFRRSTKRLSVLDSQYTKRFKN